MLLHTDDPRRTRRRPRLCRIDPTGGRGRQHRGGNPPYEETAEEPTDEPSEPAVATFREKYTYEDGVEVEVTKINHGKVTRADAGYAEAKAGSQYVSFTIRVKNGSKAKLDAYNMATLTYGPDGEAAESPYLSSLDTKDYDVDMSGKILTDRSKIAVETLLIPAKHQMDPVLEFSFDSDHEAAIFSVPCGEAPGDSDVAWAACSELNGVEGGLRHGRPLCIPR